MTDSELLVQRFLDQDLSAEERVQFLARLGRDEDLRERLISLEELALEASRLPPPVVPERFVAQVMDRAAPAQPIWDRVVDLLWSPRTLHWNLATAAALSCLTLVVAATLLTRPSSPTDAQSTASEATPSTVLVRLTVVQPGAQTVQVAGDFNGWNPVQTPLKQVSDAAWTVTLPLEPGRYEYMFVIDGEHWIADPFAAEQNDDGFGSRNAVLDVRPLETTKASL